MNRTATAVCDDYVAISLSILLPSVRSIVSLFTRDPVTGRMQLFLRAGVSVTQQKLDQLAKEGRRKLYIRADEHGSFQQYLRETLAGSVNDESVSLKRRFGMVNVVVRDVLGEAFNSFNVTDTVKKTQELGESTVELLCRDDVVASELCSVLYHDYHTFTHSANVAYYCVMLAKQLGITGKQELNQLVVGALLHDVGKLSISDHILTKPARLTEAEFNIIKRHPLDGFVLLSGRQDLSFAQLMMVYQHHERLDGGGYPVRCAADEIHPWARICTVCDVFEALTSNRPYRSGLPFDVAFEIMERDCGTAFDKEIYQCWKQTIVST